MGANSAEWNNPLDRISNFCPSLPPSLPPLSLFSRRKYGPQKTPTPPRRSSESVIGSSEAQIEGRGGQNLLAGTPVTRPQCDRRCVVILC